MNCRAGGQAGRKMERGCRCMVMTTLNSYAHTAWRERGRGRGQASPAHLEQAFHGVLPQHAGPRQVGVHVGVARARRAPAWRQLSKRVAEVEVLVQRCGVLGGCCGVATGDDLILDVVRQLAQAHLQRQHDTVGSERLLSVMPSNDSPWCNAPRT